MIHYIVVLISMKHGGKEPKTVDVYADNEMDACRCATSVLGKDGYLAISATEVYGMTIAYD